MDTLTAPISERDERRIYAGAARLDKAIDLLSDLRAQVASPLPIADAESEMDEIEDLMNAVDSKLITARRILRAAIDGAQIAEADLAAANDDVPDRRCAISGGRF